MIDRDPEECVSASATAQSGGCYVVRLKRADGEPVPPILCTSAARAAALVREMNPPNAEAVLAQLAGKDLWAALMMPTSKRLKKIANGWGKGTGRLVTEILRERGDLALVNRFHRGELAVSVSVTTYPWGLTNAKIVATDAATGAEVAVLWTE